MASSHAVSPSETITAWLKAPPFQDLYADLRVFRSLLISATLFRFLGFLGCVQKGL